MLNALLNRTSFSTINREINENIINTINIESQRINLL